MGESRSLPAALPLRRAVAALAACALAAVALACGWPAAPVAAGAQKKPGVEVLGGAKARTVQLQVCPRRATAGAEPPHVCKSALTRPYLGGRLTVKVRGTIKGIRTLRVRYLRGEGTRAIPLPGRSRKVFLIGGNGKPRKHGRLKTKGSRPLRLPIGFAVPAGQSASALDGTLRISMQGRPPVEVPVSGAARTYEGVTVTPASLTLDSADDGTKLALEGPELLEYLRSHGGERLRAILYGDNGDTAEAELTLPTAARVRKEDEGVANGRRSEFRATPEVTLVESDPAAGKYAGKLALPGLPADAGSLDVALHAHDCLPLLLLIVFCGVVAAGVGSRLVTTAARRKLLTKVLDQTHDAYLHIRGTGRQTRGWDLDDLLAEDSGEDGEPRCEWRCPRLPWTKSAELAERFRRLQGLPALRTSILMARSGKDLDEDAARVLDMVARMQRWLRVEPPARRLAELAEARQGAGKLPKDPSDPKSKKLAWRDSATARDTGVLREAVRREPESAEKADELVSRLLFQARWHNAMVELWDRAAEIEKLAPEVRELDGLLGASSTAGTRKPEEQDALEERLDRVWRKRLGDEERPEFPEIAGEQHLDCGITPVDWDASAHLFTGWATLDEPSYGQLARRAATSSRGLFMPNPTDLMRELCLLNATDWLWTLAILAVASAAYAATTYSDTWGGWVAFASAFVAGAIGKIAVNWGALPVFQSIRLRKAAPS